MENPYSEQDQHSEYIAWAIGFHAGRQLQDAVQIGDLTVNLKTREVLSGGSLIYLTVKEFEMMELMALKLGCAVTKEQFLNHLYGGMDEPEPKIIDVFIAKLRRKLPAAPDGVSYIQTVWGRGYKLEAPNTPTETR